MISMAEFYMHGEMPDEIGPMCWFNRPDAMWMRKNLREAGIQSRLLPSPIMGLYLVQALPDLPRPAGEKFCAPEDDDV